MRRLLGISSMLVMSLIIILFILKIVSNVNQLKKGGFNMKYFYESVNEYENAVKNNGWKVIDFGGKRERFLSALVETQEGKLEALLILR